jgi:ferritin-like metal-binding protein YciE
MSHEIEDQLVSCLSNAHALEKQAILLLERGAMIVGDEEIARIYRAHKLQTEEHERYVSERLQAHGESPSRTKDMAAQAGALGIGALAQMAPDTPLTLATTAFAFEHAEIATYRLLGRLAQRAGDEETAVVARRILEEEEAAAELVQGTFERTLDLVLGEPARSPLPGVTPLGAPSERPAADQHEGPQDYKNRPPDHPGTPPTPCSLTARPSGSTSRPRAPAMSHPRRLGADLRQQPCAEVRQRLAGL